MAIINVTGTDGNTRAIEIDSGLSLMETLREHDYEQILAMCGGCCSCATCHVHVDASNCKALPPIEEDEQMLIEMVDNYDPALSRLSCQIELDDEFDGLQVTIVEND